jgi:hypothetical protein
MTLHIHVGLPKTASSFLEGRFKTFEAKGWSINDPKLIDIARGCAFPECAEPGMTFARVLKHERRPTLISYDALCGDPYTSFADRKVVLERLATSCGDIPVKIFMMVRRQPDWIESIFRQSLHEYYFTPFRHFVRWPGEQSQRHYPSVDIDQLDWNGIVEGFVRAFGSQAVCVLPYEMLSTDAVAFMSILSAHLGETIEAGSHDRVVNRGYGALSCSIALAINPWLREKSRFGLIPNRPFYYALKKRRTQPIYGRLFAWSSRLSLRSLLQNYVDRHFWSPPRLFNGDEKAKIIEICTPANKRLAPFTKADLTAYGYF